ncbi:Hsp70 family protein [Actinomadura algeriensis]|uniref:Molecular chaperone DnaK (HSP70) n=1 Tax=Actinomadura algeriensis TaxID=1679523 RepID=A0ABR9K2J1_9ACTN|nr:Hsp70 family protein [Actinomadura algeriensis]MBE1537042.1 molecular chaperone DnaK (HSP70) [Actinomadura algeriensis]
MNDSYGIDFGTTNSVVARVTARDVETIALDPDRPAEWDGTGFDRVLPSVIGFDRDAPLFGWAAKTRTGARIDAVKRMFATEDTVRAGTTELRVEEAAALFFRHLQTRVAQAGFTTPLDRAVVTIPANSRGVARYRTKLSAGLAGIEVSALINEPTAAAMAHARRIGSDQRVLVFDWGGGTLDVTVLQSFEGTFIEQASKGVQRLGGIDLDRAFADAVLPAVGGASRWGAHERTIFALNLELAKIRLSTATSAVVALPGGRGHVDVTRDQLERAVLPLVERTREPVETCLRESPGRIDHLVMVGGSAKPPLVRRFVSDLVGAPADDSVDPMTAIAEGAAIAAGILHGTVTDLDFHVGTEHALGTIVHNDAPQGKFSVLIPRNTKYPARATDSYMAARPYQEEVDIQVIEGDPGKPIDDDDNVVLKVWSVPLVEPRPVERSAFDVTYEYDVDGILHVTARDHLTGTLMMDEELSFGAGENKSELPKMRRRVDGLMDPERVTRPPSPEGRLSPESEAAMTKATKKILPFVEGHERDSLERLVTALAAAAPDEEQARRDALVRELRRYAYLL